MIKAAIFDLDGTLADTVESIAYSANRALVSIGLSPFETERFCYFAGDGSAELIRRCLRENGDIQCTRFEEMKEIYGTYFSRDCMYHVRPYDGIRETLKELNKKQIRLAVLSNKPHLQAVHVVEDLFGEGFFDIIQGQQEGIPRKPSPEGALRIAESFGVRPSECLYVGDTGTDMQTGNAAGMETVGVLWGFRTKAELEENHAGRLIHHPQELININERDDK